MEHSLLKKGIAEFIGTLVLVFFACGTAILTGDVVATALAFGLCIVAMAYSIGNISGCHINPAVSIGMLVAKKMNVKEFLVYIAAQFFGATVGAALLYAILLGTGNLTGSAWATNAIVGEGVGGIFSSMAAEIVLTFVFVFAILGVTSKTENSKINGIVIGSVLTLVHLFGIGVTGTSVNPARSFGPALVSLLFGGPVQAITDYWVFLVAPLIGGVLAALVYGILFKNKNQVEL